MKRRRQGWPPLTAAKKAITNAREIERAMAEQEAGLRDAPSDGRRPDHVGTPTTVSGNRPIHDR